MKKTLHDENPLRWYHDSQLNLLEKLGWSHFNFDKLVNLVEWWNKKGQPSFINGCTLKHFDNSHNTKHLWGEIFNWKTMITIDAELDLTEYGREVFLTLSKNTGSRYAKHLDFDRNTTEWIRRNLPDLKHRKVVCGHNTYYFVHESMFKPEDDEVPLARKVAAKASLREDIAAASPARLLELLKPFEAPFLKECVKLYRKEKFVPYGIALNVKNFLHENAIH